MLIGTIRLSARPQTAAFFWNRLLGTHALHCSSCCGPRAASCSLHASTSPICWWHAPSLVAGSSRSGQLWAAAARVVLHHENTRVKVNVHLLPQFGIRATPAEIRHSAAGTGTLWRQNTLSGLDGFVRNFKYGARALRRSPGFAGVSIVATNLTAPSAGRKRGQSPGFPALRQSRDPQGRIVGNS